ncbi:hypothetical protein DFA_09846 [Cavenderia fasciculata]|uniref:Acyltransferase 3 domain-containing protein n=1 Tax=Cavenderia fasciculata TaxID=261658 RepID=F4QAW5_CACFS|nr:uncharacterized protein DFA_09846 [Cavenderia fasciculata]EGG15024.1 hypothetical protein DFA_09846 [Cavenderia fasciculata]|eukprot:XP_004351744.1 hypothetical protein DFA_09846 [Cavenderia fasciculata]
MKSLTNFLLLILVLQLLSLLLLFNHVDAISNQCKNDIDIMLDYKNNSNSFKMITNSGKSMNDMGNFDQCLMLPNASYSVYDTEIKSERPKPVGVYRYLVGLCLPRSCDTDQDVIDAIPLLPYFIPSANLSVREPVIKHYVPGHTTERDITPGSIVMMVVCSIIVLLVIIGTILDILVFSKATTATADNDHPHCRSRRINPTFKLIFLSFSLKNNLYYFSKISTPTGEYFGTMDGFRVLGMIWVILGHTTLFQFPMSGELDKELTVFAHGVAFAVSTGGVYCVDIFFMLGGFLVSNSLLKYFTKQPSNNNNNNVDFTSEKSENQSDQQSDQKLEQQSDQQTDQQQNNIQQDKPKNNNSKRFTGKFWFMYIINRLLRLSPPFYFTLFFYWLLVPLIGRGPLWYRFKMDLIGNCDKYWWTNVLYINSIYPFSMQDTPLAWSWYLSDDMIFYLLTPLYIFAYLRIGKRFGLAVIGLTVIGSVAATTILSIRYDMVNYFVQWVQPTEFASDIYQKPWCRITPYVIGVASAMIFRDYRKQLHDHLYKSIVTRYTLYTLNLGVLLVCIFLPMNAKEWTPEHWSSTASGFFNGFSNTLLTLSMSYFFIATFLGYASFLITLFSLTIWKYLSKLVYCTYLVHAILIIIRVYSSPILFVVDFYGQFWFFMANLLLSFIYAFILHLTIERPFNNLLRPLLN